MAAYASKIETSARNAMFSVSEPVVASHFPPTPLTTILLRSTTRHPGNMKEAIEDEIEAINSIYGDGTLVAADEAGVYVLKLPDQDTSFGIKFPDEYPHVPLTVLGTQKSGENTRKGQAAYVLDVFRDAVGRLFQPGEVCLYDVIEDVTARLKSADAEPELADEESPLDRQETQPTAVSHDAPPWTISDVVVELKSVFVARCAPVASPDQAKQHLQHLLNSDKKVAKATHNITAHRIKGDNGVTYQDCDDDGETAAGGRLLHLMQLMDLWNVMVVVTRWYGGQKLGPARFGIINTVARDSFVKGGFVHEQEPASSKKKGKR